MERREFLKRSLRLASFAPFLAFGGCLPQKTFRAESRESLETKYFTLENNLSCPVLIHSGALERVSRELGFKLFTPSSLRIIFTDREDPEPKGYTIVYADKTGSKVEVKITGIEEEMDQIFNDSEYFDFSANLSVYIIRGHLMLKYWEKEGSKFEKDKLVDQELEKYIQKLEEDHSLLVASLFPRRTRLV